MDFDEKLKGLLSELSSAISRSLSMPENLEKLEELQQNGYDLYLILEARDESANRIDATPIVPIQPENIKPEKKKPLRFELSREDKDFLRTLKIKVD